MNNSCISNFKSVLTFKGVFVFNFFIIFTEVTRVNINENSLESGIDFAWKNTTMVGQFFMELPTEAGFPVSLQAGVNVLTNIKGQIQASVDPSMFREVRDNEPTQDAFARIDVQPK